MADPSSLRPLLSVVARLMLVSLLCCSPVHSATLPGQSFPANTGMPQIQSLDAKCGRSGMTVQVSFDQPFPGVIYSKGHYADEKCNYVTEKSAGSTSYTFLVPIDGCGTHGQLEESRPDRDMYFENTIIVQLDPLITEVWDEARLLKCVWPHTMLRRVYSSPFEVYQPQRVSVMLDKRSINTLMEIQQGPGPFDSPATGYVYMGDDTSVVIYVQDPDQSADANVVNCSATSVGGASVQLLDDYGCIMRPDLMTHFDKSRKTNGVKADLMLYSYLKAFRIGESPEFTIRCQLEVCRGKCSEPCSNGPVLAKRRKRDTNLVEVESVDPKGGSMEYLDSEAALLQSSDFDAAILESSDIDAATLESLDPEAAILDREITKEPAVRVNLEQAVLVVEREEIEEVNGWCDSSPCLMIAGLVMLLITAVLSLLTCTLTYKLDKLSQGKK